MGFGIARMPRAASLASAARSSGAVELGDVVGGPAGSWGEDALDDFDRCAPGFPFAGGYWGDIDFAVVGSVVGDESIDDLQWLLARGYYADLVEQIYGYRAEDVDAMAEEGLGTHGVWVLAVLFYVEYGSPGVHVDFYVFPGDAPYYGSIVPFFCRPEAAPPWPS